MWLEISMSTLLKPDPTVAAWTIINNESYIRARTYFLCVLSSAAPPVTFADIPEEDLFKSVVEQEQFVLSCEVSRADGVVQWYKDGIEMQPCDNMTTQAEGTKRHLAVHSAQLSDTGTYTCRAGDNILMYKVNIRGKKIVRQILTLCDIKNAKRRVHACLNFSIAYLLPKNLRC